MTTPVAFLTFTAGVMAVVAVVVYRLERADARRQHPTHEERCARIRARQQRRDTDIDAEFERIVQGWGP